MYAISSYVNGDSRLTIIQIINDKLKIIDSKKIERKEIRNPRFDLKIYNDILYYNRRYEVSYKLKDKLEENTDDFSYIRKRKTDFLYNIPLELFEEYYKCVARYNIGDYAVLIIENIKHADFYEGFYVDSKVIIVNINKMEVVKEILTHSSSSDYHSHYYQDNKLFLTFCIDYHTSFSLFESRQSCTVIEVSINGMIDSYEIYDSDISDKFQCDYNNNENYENIYDHCSPHEVGKYYKAEYKKKGVPKFICDYYRISSHENLIMYHDKHNNFCLYDYVNKKIIISTKLENIGGASCFVKIKEKEIDKKVNMSLIENLYYNKDYADIEIETNDGSIMAHKLILLNISSYFKELLSGKYKENNKIKFDISKNTLENVLEYAYLNDLNYRSINELLDIYSFCDEIFYENLKNKVSDLLFNKYCLDESMTTVKIYSKSMLKNLPESINTIIFDHSFDYVIDGLIPNNIKKIIFGMNFNKPISILPNSVKIIEFGKWWNCSLSDLPDTIEEIICGQDFNKKIIKYPKNLKSIILPKDYKKKNCIPENLISPHDIIIDQYEQDKYNDLSFPIKSNDSKQNL